MGLASPSSAILSAVIFNALIIILLIPLALRGVRYRPLGAAALFRRSMLIYGVGGVIAPFAGIKLIDLVPAAVRTSSERKSAMRTLRICLQATLVTLLLTGLALPPGHDRPGQRAVPAAGARQPGHRRPRPGGRLGAHRPGVHQPGLLPGPALGGRQRLRRHRLRRVEPRPDLGQAARPGEGGRRAAAQGEPRGARCPSPPSWSPPRPAASTPTCRPAAALLAGARGWRAPAGCRRGAGAAAASTTSPRAGSSASWASPGSTCWR